MMSSPVLMLLNGKPTTNMSVKTPQIYSPKYHKSIRRPLQVPEKYV